MNSVNKKELIGQLNIHRLVLILLVICVSATMLSPGFLSVTSLFNVLKQVTVADTVGCEMTSVTLTGGVDLSVGSILGLTGILASDILEPTENAGVAILVVLVTGIGCGVISGLSAAVCEIPPFTSTLGTITLFHGCILVYTKDSFIPIKVNAYKFFGEGTMAGAPVPVIILITLFPIAHYVLTQTSYSRGIYAFEGNRKAARLSGISIRFTEWMAYILSGLICGIAGAILTTRLSLTQSTSGTGTEMDAIAAAILSGASLNDGVGFVFLTVMGTMTMGIIGNILMPMNISPHATSIVKGAAILIAVLVDKKMKDLLAKAK